MRICHNILYSIVVEKNYRRLLCFRYWSLIKLRNIILYLFIDAISILNNISPKRIFREISLDPADLKYLAVGSSMRRELLANLMMVTP